MPDIAPFEDIRTFIELIHSIETDEDIEEVYKYFTTNSKLHNNPYHIDQIYEIILSAYTANYRNEKLYIKLIAKFSELYPNFAIKILKELSFPSNCKYEIIYPNSDYHIIYTDSFKLCDKLKKGTIINIYARYIYNDNNNTSNNEVNNTDNNIIVNHKYINKYNVDNNNSNDNNNVDNKVINYKYVNRYIANNNLIKICSIIISDANATNKFEVHETVCENLINYYQSKRLFINICDISCYIKFTNEAINILELCLKADYGIERDENINVDLSINIEKAIKYDDIDTLQQLISTFDYEKLTKYEYLIDIPINSLPQYHSYPGYSMFDLTIIYGSVKCFKYLMLNGCYEQGNRNVISYAIIGANYEIFHILEQQNKDIEWKQYFEVFIKNGNLDLFKYWFVRLDKLPNIDHIIHYVLSYYRYDILGYLLDINAIDIKNKCWFSQEIKDDEGNITNIKSTNDNSILPDWFYRANIDDNKHMILINQIHQYCITSYQIEQNFEAVDILMNSYEEFNETYLVMYINSVEQLHRMVCKGFLKNFYIDDEYNEFDDEWDDHECYTTSLYYNIEHSIRFQIIIDFIYYNKPIDMIKYIVSTPYLKIETPIALSTSNKENNLSDDERKFIIDYINKYYKPSEDDYDNNTKQMILIDYFNTFK